MNSNFVSYQEEIHVNRARNAVKYLYILCLFSHKEWEGGDRPVTVCIGEIKQPGFRGLVAKISTGDVGQFLTCIFTVFI